MAERRRTPAGRIKLVSIFIFFWRVLRNLNIAYINVVKAHYKVKSASGQWTIQSELIPVSIA